MPRCIMLARIGFPNEAGFLIFSRRLCVTSESPTMWDVNTSEGEFSLDPTEFLAFAARLQTVGNEMFRFSSGQHRWKFSYDTRRGFCRYSSRSAEDLTCQWS